MKGKDILSYNTHNLYKECAEGVQRATGKPSGIICKGKKLFTLKVGHRRGAGGEGLRPV